MSSPITNNLNSNYRNSLKLNLSDDSSNMSSLTYGTCSDSEDDASTTTSSLTTTTTLSSSTGPSSLSKTIILNMNYCGNSITQDDVCLYSILYFLMNNDKQKIIFSLK